MVKFWYSYGHPEGFTDDLGIIADRNQYVKEEFPGWYCARSDWQALPISRGDLECWLIDNLTSGCKIDEYGRIFIPNEQDLNWFILKWS